MIKKILSLSLVTTFILANESFYDPFNYTKKEILKQNKDNNIEVESIILKLPKNDFNISNKELEIKKQETINEDEFDKLVREATENKNKNKNKNKKIETISVDDNLDRIPSTIIVDQKLNSENKNSNIKGNLVSLNGSSKKDLTLVKEINEIKDIKISKDNNEINIIKNDSISNDNLDNGLYFDKNLSYILLYTTEDLFLTRNKMLLNNILNYKLLKDRKNDKNYGVVINKDEYNYDKIKSLYRDNKILNYDKLKELFYLDKKY